MFSLKDFVMDTLKDMIGKQPDYMVKHYSLNWFNRQVLTEEDLAVIQSLIKEKNKPIEMPPMEEPIPESEVVNNE